MAGFKSTVLLIVVNAAAVTLDTSDHSSVSTTVAVISGMLWLIYICTIFVDQMISMVTTSIMGGGDEDEEKEAHDRRAAQVEMASRAMAAQAKAAEAKKLDEQLTAVIIKRGGGGG